MMVFTKASYAGKAHLYLECLFQREQYRASSVIEITQRNQPAITELENEAILKLADWRLSSGIH